MIRKIKRRSFASLIALLAFILAAVTLACPLLTVAAATAEEREEVKNEYDFSSPGSLYKETLKPSELLSALGHTVSPEEGEYLDKKDSLCFSYDVGVTTANLRVLLSDSTSDATVLANEYTYTSGSGTVVTWIPTKVAYGEKVAYFAPLDDGGFSYSATVINTGVAADDITAAVTVTYESEFVFTAAAVNAILNLPWLDANTAKEKIDKNTQEYERLFKIHQEESARFAAYLLEYESYTAKKALYDSYLLEKAEYESKVIARENYLLALEEYEKLLEEYTTFKTVTEPEYEKAYVRYLEYKEKYDRYLNTELAAYEKNAAELARFRAHLSIIETVKTPMTDGRTLYDAIMGSTVTQVLSRQKEIVAAGIPAELVTIAGDATEALRELFGGYFSLTSEEDKYFYYHGNYAALRDNFTNLLRALDYFYTFDNNKGLVRTELVNSDKAKKYVILLAQLYLISSNLNDGRIYAYSPNGTGKEFTDSYTWSYSESARQEIRGDATVVTYLSMLDGVRYLTDTNTAAPYDTQFPEEMQKPAAPEEVLMPEPIETLYEPQEPTFVPEAPEAPQEAEEPQEPTQVPAPTSPPVPYVPTEDEAWLAKALEDGKISLYEEYTAPVTLKRSLTLDKKISSATQTVVYFYGTEASSVGEEPIYITVVDTGTAANFSGTVPTKASDNYYSYTFLGWVDGSGNAVDLSSVDESHLYLYPSYTKTPVLYSVSWITGTGVTEQSYRYGELPSFDGTPASYKDSSFVYYFRAWDKTVAPVSGSVVYTALYDAVPYYTVKWRIGNEIITEEYLEGEIPTPPTTTPTRPDSELNSYTFVSWDKAFIPVSSNVTYSALFKMSYRLPVGNKGASVSSDGTTVTVNTAVANASGVDITPILDLLSGKSLVLVTPDAEVTLEAKTVTSMLSSGVRIITLGTQANGTSFTYKLTLADKSGTELKPDGGYTYSLKFNAPDGYKPSMRFFSGSAEDKVFYPTELKDGNILVNNLKTAMEYRLANQYKIGVITTDGLSVSLSTDTATVGERVTVSYTVTDGKVLNNLYYVTKDGTEVLITDGAFVMPDTEIKLWGSLVTASYKIRFVNFDGRYIERTCSWGEIPTPPSFVRNSDESYSYTFLGWDSEIVPASEDKVYTAVYDTVELEEKNSERTFDSGFEKFKYYITLYAINIYRQRVLVIVSFCVSIGALVGLIVFKKYRKKHPIS